MLVESVRSGDVQLCTSPESEATHLKKGLDVRSRMPLIVAASLAVTAFALCLAYAVHGGWPLRYGDEAQYVQIAFDLVSGHGYQAGGNPTAYRPPAWPLVIAAALVVGAPSAALLVLPVLLMGLSAILSALIAVRITGSSWGAVAGPLCMLYPLNFYTASTMYPQALATALLLGIWYVSIRATRDAQGFPELSNRGAVAVAVQAAMLVLAVPTMAFSAAVIIAWISWGFARRANWAGVAWLWLSLAVPMLCWTLRNATVLHAFIPLSTSAGENLLIGNNPSSGPTSGWVDPGTLAPVPDGMTEVQRDAYFRETGLAWIQSNPGEAVVLWLGKMVNYFSGYNSPATAEQGSHGAMILGWVSLFLLLGAVSWRLVSRHNSPIWRSEVLYLALFLLNAPVMAVFFTRVRFRQPLDACLVVVAAVAVSGVLESIQSAIKSRRAGQVVRGNADESES